jgi:peptide/nickel transport system substrate-binding protein
MKKTQFVIILGALMFAQMLIVNARLGSAAPAATFIYGVGSGPVELEPTDAYDSASIDVIMQTCEGLYMNDLSSADMALTPNLAANMGTWNTAATELTVPLVTNAKFQDGTVFNASSVKWNFDRLNEFVMNSTMGLQTAVLYQLPDGKPILNRTEIVDQYTVKFVLNEPYILWQKLMAFSSAYIIKPDASYQHRFLTFTDPLIGTGPYTFVKYIPDTSINFTRYDQYHRGAGQIPNMVWEVITDSDARSLAFMNGEIHMIDEVDPTYLDQYKNTTTITVKDINRALVYYIAYNTHLISLPMRQALSYAANKSYIVDSIMLGQAIPINNPVPTGIEYGYDIPDAPYYNVTQARQILVNAGLSGSLTMASTDAQWLAVADGSSPLATLNYTTHSTTRYKVGQVLQENYRHIGVKMDLPAKITWDEFVNKMNGNNGHSKDELLISMGGWQPDYNDPSDMINPLYDNLSVSNQFQLNNATLQTWMAQGIVMQDGAARETLYHNIEHLIAVDQVPSMMLWQSKGHDAYNNQVIGNYPTNIFGYVYFYPCTFNPSAMIDGFNAIAMIFVSLGTALFLIYKKRMH